LSFSPDYIQDVSNIQVFKLDKGKGIALPINELNEVNPSDESTSLEEQGGRNESLFEQALNESRLEVFNTHRVGESSRSARVWESSPSDRVVVRDIIARVSSNTVNTAIGSPNTSSISVNSGFNPYLLKLDLPRVNYITKELMASIKVLKPSVDFSAIIIEPIITSHLVLRMLDKSDIPELRRIIREPSLRFGQIWDHLDGEDISENFGSRDKDSLALEVFIKTSPGKEGKLKGLFHLSNFEAQYKSIPSISGSIMRELEEKGYGTEALFVFF
jgi:hypothetical protein